MSEFEHEPIRGLPGNLPEGEHILWQGAPEWRSLAKTAMHVRLIGGYFAIIATWGVLTAAPLLGIVITLGVGIVAIALLAAFGWAASKSTVYTLTNKRLVLRFGVALPMCINLPLAQIATARVQQLGHGMGDIALALTGPERIGYLRLWPHARAWQIGTPEPMLRSLPDVDTVAALLTQTLLAAVPAGRRVATVDTAPEPAFGPAATAA